MDNSKENRIKDLMDKVHEGISLMRKSAEEIYAEFQDEGPSGRMMADHFIEDFYVAQRQLFQKMRKLRDTFSTKY